MQRLLISSLSLVAFGASAYAQATPDPAAAPVEPAPPEAVAPPVVQPAPPPPPAPVEPPKPVITSKWDGQLYGFVELDTIYDSTQGLNDLAGNAAIAKSGSYAGDHGQTTMAARNSRIGYRLNAPEYHGIKASAQLEMDFLGNQPPGISEASFFQNAGFRYRHLNLKLETPYVDVLVGQSWQLFGWQSLFHPNTVDIQGVPAQVYSRAPQIRVSKKIKSGDIGVELALAALRPPQRASATPDGQAGVKLTYDKLKAYHTAGGTGSALDSAAIGVSVIGRRFAVNEFAPMSLKDVTANGYGISVDALIPVVPATKEHRDNALTLMGNFVTGAGIADQYTGLSGGVRQPTLPAPDGGGAAPVYTPNVDNGLVEFLADGSLHAVQWTSFLVGAQYYLPGGKAFLSANYSHLSSDNAHAFGPAASVWDKSDWAEGNLFVDATPAVRFGFGFSWYNQQFVDGSEATNYRAQLSGWFIF